MDRAALDLVISDLAGTPHGERTAAVERAAALYAVSKATLYRRLAALGHGGPKRPRDPARPELRAWAETLIQLASKAPGRTIPLDLALRAAVREGLLPAEAGEVDIGTYNRVLREGGYRQTQRRTRRISAEWPMQGVQFDASTSAHLVVVKSLSDGDALLRLFRDPMPASGYKNKPLGPERLRVVYYGLWDVCTGLRHMRATAARGEAGIPAMEYLVGAFEGGGDPRQPFQGLPDDLWSDQGPIVKHDATRDLLERMGINVLTGAPYQKTRQGGIESGWRTAWGRFEESLFMLQVGRSNRLLKFPRLRTRIKPGRQSRLGGRFSR